MPSTARAWGPASSPSAAASSCAPGKAEALEGALVPKRVVVLEFPDYERAKAWWDSPGYRELRALRQRASRGDLIVVEGV